MHDFLSPKLLPKVSSDIPPLDNYEVTNLISEDFVIRSRGFLAYSTVKPPVEITFELICPINIYYINLSTVVGTQKCTAIELLSKKFNESFVSIGYAKFDSNGVIFCNRRFYATNKCPPNINKTYSLNFFKANSYKSFTTANFVKVRILQTARSVPCLGKVEIWGKPSKLCSLTTLNSITHLLQGTSTSNSEDVTLVATKQVTVPNDWEIPEEFKDMLTFEVMSVPLTLPSGKTVDKSSLDKYLANESVYGRPASDPFTGLTFTDTRKPLVNTALKSRIDMFLLHHSENPETFTIKRTLGKSSLTNNKFDESLNTKKLKVSESHSEPEIGKIKDADTLLEEAIRKTMNSNEFIKFSSMDEVTVPASLCCSKCKITNSLYVVSCDHLYCRNCLLNFGKNSICCILCNKPFLKSDARKYHS